MAPKKIIQDIVPTGRRSIRNIPLNDDDEIIPEEVKPKPKKIIEIRKIVEEPREEVYKIREDDEIVSDETVEEPVVNPKNIRQPGPKKKKSSGKFILSFLIIFICIGVIALALSLSYSKAIVTITPKVVNFDVNGTFTAKKDAPYGDLGYEVITVTDEDSKSLVATKGGSVETKAKGLVTIYNSYAATAQTLVAGTRLAGENGLIYRTTSTVSIPGKKTTPGSLDVEVVADQPGENYNTTTAKMGDMEVVAFKGTERESGFYAKVKTSLSGGFKGSKMIVDETEKNKTVAEIENSLKAKIQAKIDSTVPKDYVVYDSAYSIEFDIPEPTMKEDNSALITVKAAAYVPIFKSDSLIKYIAGNEIKRFPSDTYRIEGEEKLEFKTSNSKDFSAKKATPLIFTLKGPISIVGTFDESKLKGELVGISLANSNAIFAKYTSISNAYALITPFWMRSFPKSIEKIKIEYK